MMRDEVEIDVVLVLAVNSWYRVELKFKCFEINIQQSTALYVLPCVVASVCRPITQ